MQQIKIILADDHEVVRTGLRRILSVDKNFQVLDEAGNGQDAITLVNYHKPDIIIIDILMPGMSGIEAAMNIKKQSSTYVVMLTAYEDSNHLEKAMSAGADAYLTKDIGTKDLFKALYEVMDGKRILSKSILKLSQKQRVSKLDLLSQPIKITKREQDVLNLIAEGNKNSEIADILNVSVRTVESHRYNLMQKLGVKTTAELVRYAVFNAEVLDESESSM